MFKIAKIYRPFVEGRDILRAMQDYFPEVEKKDLINRLYEELRIKSDYVVGAIPFQMPPNNIAIKEYYGNNAFISLFVEILMKEANIGYNEIVFINMPA